MSGRTLSKLALASLLILPLGTTGCSQGQSPTEPSLMEEATSSASAAQGDKRRGADDPAGHVRRGRGADDPAGDDRGRRRRGRGADDRAGDDHGRRGRGADDPAGHD